MTSDTAEGSFFSDGLLPFLFAFFFSTSPDRFSGVLDLRPVFTSGHSFEALARVSKRIEPSFFLLVSLFVRLYLPRLPYLSS